MTMSIWKLFGLSAAAAALLGPSVMASEMAFSCYSGACPQSMPFDADQLYRITYTPTPGNWISSATWSIVSATGQAAVYFSGNITFPPPNGLNPVYTDVILRPYDQVPRGTPYVQLRIAWTDVRLHDNILIGASTARSQVIGIVWNPAVAANNVTPQRQSDPLSTPENPTTPPPSGNGTAPNPPAPSGTSPRSAPPVVVVSPTPSASPSPPPPSEIVLGPAPKSSDAPLGNSKSSSLSVGSACWSVTSLMGASLIAAVLAL